MGEWKWAAAQTFCHLLTSSFIVLGNFCHIDPLSVTHPRTFAILRRALLFPALPVMPSGHEHFEKTVLMAPLRFYHQQQGDCCLSTWEVVTAVHFQHPRGEWGRFR